MKPRDPKGALLVAVMLGGPLTYIGWGDPLSLAVVWLIVGPLVIAGLYWK